MDETVGKRQTEINGTPGQAAGEDIAEREERQRLNESLLSFIRKSPCSFQAVEALRERLCAEGFTELLEGEHWMLSPGSYFVTRNHSALIAFTIPERPREALLSGGVRIAASHADSPSFKLKEHPEMCVEGKYVRLNVERYGGMLCAPWFDRPLSVAGRVFVRTGEEETTEEGAALCPEAGYSERLLAIDEDLLLIPNVAIHMNRKANEGYAYDPQKDMLPLYALGEPGRLMKRIAEEAGAAEEDILGHDLFLYCRAEGSIWGPCGEFVSAPRLDDLQCAFGTMEGFLSAARSRRLSLCCVFDNEEVGSETRQGAGATFLYDILRRICCGLGCSEEDYLILLDHGFMVSADNAHAVHPNHPELCDPTNRPCIGGGIVIKYNAQQKYCTDGGTAAFFRSLCRRAGVPVQSFANRSDMVGGSTLGNISNTKVALRSVDIGLAQLAMHSPYETAGTADTLYLKRAMREFYA